MNESEVDVADSPSPTAALTAEGVSIWLDDLSRERIISGALSALISDRNVVGITTNPTIFATALAQGHAYDAQMAALAMAGSTVAEAIFEVTTHDVAAAADILRPIYDSTGGRDGWVSIEVSPNAAHDATASVDEAKRLRAKIDRPNTFIKIPATVEGLHAITTAIASGISINVTLIFSLDRYRGVIDAYISGLEQASTAGIDLAGIRSVASFFVSRVDAEIDKRLGVVGTTEALSLTGSAGVANARLAYEIFEHEFATERARHMIALGATVQRPLWASTGVKDPALLDTTYVVELVAPNVVNTMPETTLQATHDHGVIRGNTVTGTYEEARSILQAIASQGVSYDDATLTLEKEGIARFVASYDQLAKTVEKALNSAR